MTDARTHARVTHSLSLDQTQTRKHTERQWREILLIFFFCACLRDSAERCSSTYTTPKCTRTTLQLFFYFTWIKFFLFFALFWFVWFSLKLGGTIRTHVKILTVFGMQSNNHKIMLECKENAHSDSELISDVSLCMCVSACVCRR